jgi:hypothetical protein
MTVKVFECPRCGYECNARYLLIKHFNRKKACPTIRSTETIPELLIKWQKPSDGQYKCTHCEKMFNDSSNKRKHEKVCKSCKTRNNDIDELKATVSSIQQQLTSFPNVTINQQNIHITLNNFGNETYDHLSAEFIRNCILNQVSGVKALIEKIHFSDEVPNNKNVRLRSLKNNLVEVANDQRWIVKDANEAMEIMINKGCRILNGYYYDKDNDIMNYDIDTLDSHVQHFLCTIMDKQNNRYFDLRRRILALIIEHSGTQ